VRKSGSEWLCAEVYLQQSYGFGEYFIEIESDVEQYDPNLVMDFLPMRPMNGRSTSSSAAGTIQPSLLVGIPFSLLHIPGRIRPISHWD
jgi:hypothetical protein